MKTTSYNPSKLEVMIAKAITEMNSEINEKIDGHQIFKVENKIQEDNPVVRLYLLDDDGDPHEVVLKVIQTPDKF